MRFAFPELRIGWAPLAIALSGLLLSLLPLSAELEGQAGLGLLYALRGPETPPDHVAIVGIDRDSAVRLQAPDDPPDWPRQLHAQMIRQASRGGAELVAFNIFFSASALDPGADKAMADAMREAGNVVLTDYVKPRHVHAGVYVESVVEPSTEIADAALATAPFLLPKSPGGANAFLTHFGDEEKRATLPSLLFFAYSLHTQAGALAKFVLPADPALADLIANIGPNPGQMARSDYNALAKGLADQWHARPEPSAATSPAPADDALSGTSRRLLRSLARTLQGDGVRYFNHYGPARTFPIIPYHELVQPAPGAPAAALKGKLLLVGYMDDFQPETTEGTFYTPYSSTSAVELAATALANLLEDKWVQPAFAPPYDALWLLAWGGLLGVLAQRLSIRPGLTLIAALGAAYLATAWLLFQAQGVWLSIAIPLGWQTSLALIFSLSLNYRRGARREQAMQSVIHRFIPVDVFSHLTRHQDHATLPSYGRLTKGLCLATDAGRYTALAETLEPMALARLMNAYYGAIFEPVTRRGGWVSDVVGDAMLAIWVADDADDRDLRQQALHAALDILEAVRRFEKQYELVLPIRMGLHFGDLRIGYVGTAERGEIRAVGDTVNTAARLEALNKLLGSQILVSESVLDGLGGVEGVRPLGEFLLAGKTRPVSVLELFSRPDEPSRSGELLARFREALALFGEQRWPEAHAAFTRLGLQFPEDGPTRFYLQTCQSYLANPALAGAAAGITTQKPDPARLFNP
ncbi:CHASE2 domain-containing protein [Methylomagnum sp.]